MKSLFARQKLFLQIWGVVFVMIIGSGLYFGNIKFVFGGNQTPHYSSKAIISNLKNIQNITGELRITPYGSYDKYAATVGSTHRVLKIQTYDFTEKRFKNLFKALTGTQIKIIMEDKKFQQFQNTFRQIKDYFSGNQNIQIKSDKQMGTEYVHAKINIMDSGFIIQTANLTHSSFFTNREHFFYSHDSGVLASLNAIFDKDRGGKPLLLNDIHPNLVICNINCRTVIQELLSEAKESIIIQTQYITDPAILKILQGKNNLELKMLLANTSDNETVTKIFGSSYAKRLPKPYNHTKMILIDHRILLLGSMNLSETSLDKNREVGIIILDQGIIDGFLEQFWKDWKIGR